MPTFREELKKFWRLQAFPSDVSDVWLIRFLPTLLIVRFSPQPLVILLMTASA